MIRLNSREAGFEQAFRDLLAMKREVSEDVDTAVRGIIAAVKARGDAALAEYTLLYDKVDLGSAGIEIGREARAAARASCAPKALAALELAAERIRAYHERQKPQDMSFTDALGVRLGWRWTAVESAGLYVPGGQASYPSSVLMNAIPARVAGVERLVMVVPTPGGAVDPLVLAAADIAGVDSVYRVGGAQAIAALAFGTASIKPVSKIVGPGNAYVAAAKRQVFGVVGIDMIAGPSEVVVMADATGNPDWIAADLLAQAEHDSAAQSILITSDSALADAVADAVERQLKTLPRETIARASWDEFGAIIVTPTLDEALPMVDRLAAEHLEIHAENAEALASRVRNAGAIFIGAHTPEAIGDYVGGSNHVLPTARSARFASGLGVHDFVKRTSLLNCSPEGLRALGPAAIALGEAERLQAHARSVAIRLNLGDA